MKAKPFLKWVGGKRGLLEQLRPLLPLTFHRYHEPFVGGGAMYFELESPEAVLSDANQELINCYTAIRDTPRVVIGELGLLPIDQETFHRVRAMDQDDMKSAAARAARTIYLNKTCFNGLYRVNRTGGFNSPWGHWKADKLPTTCDAPNLMACSAALQSTVIRCCDFEDVVNQMITPSYRDTTRDFVYLDPPYVPVSKTANFTSYTAKGFDLDELHRLAVACWKLDGKGAQFMLSNADTPAVRAAFKGFHFSTVQARRAVNCDATKRGRVGELVVRNYLNPGEA